jgi:hypothetical protein
MRGIWSSRRGAVRAARVVLLVAGVTVTTASFVGLIDEHLAVVGAEPWWYIGAVGIVAVLVALGSPWNTGRPGD